MKNISRRVFIKSMAVAGVAAAASTVLAGCNTNMIPGVEDPTEEPSDQPSATTQTLTFADPADASKTVSITLSSMVVDSSLAKGPVLKFDAKVVNKKIGNVVFSDTDYALTATKVNEGDFFVVLSAFPDSNEGSSKIKPVRATYVDNVIAASSAADDAPFCTSSTDTVTKDGYVYFTVDKDLDWSKVTVQMKPYKVVSASTAPETIALNTLKYTFSK